MGRQPHRGFVSFVRNVALGDRSVTRPIALCVDMPMCLPSSHRVFGPRGAPLRAARGARLRAANCTCPKDVGAAALPTLQASTGVTDRSQVGDTGSFPEIERGGVRLVRADGRQREWRPLRRPRRQVPFAVALCRAQGARGAIARLVPLICSYVRFSSPDGGRGFCRRPRGAELWGQRPRRGRQPRGARDGRSTTDHHR